MEGIRVSLVFNGARSRQVAGDLSPWRRERRGACIGSLTIGSSTPLKTEQHLISTSLSSDTFNPRWLGPIAQKHFRSPPTGSTHDGPAAPKRFRSPPTVLNGLAYDRANSSAPQATTSQSAHGRGFFISAQWLLTCVVADLCGRSPMWSIYMLEVSSALPLCYLSVFRPLVEV